ncbi:MAG: NADH-quinone oxidoreductase subunit H [Elusimicrobia bacterium]|nr:NADH-quinone oxidoreductase subunit H [Elusimicrobiota bacterium]
MNQMIDFLIFPGLLFTAVCGMLASFVDRKVTARVQWRKGPPLFQPVYDFVKLMGKEMVVPSGAHLLTFLAAPLFGLSAIVSVSIIVWNALSGGSAGFSGDLIVVVYLLAIPSIAVIMGGFASNNPIASLGASREMKLMLAYELPFILAVMVTVIKTGSINMTHVVRAQAGAGASAVAGSPSGIIALAVAVFCIQAKLGLVPFDIPEAEQEIIAGPLIEYSGPALGVIKLTRWMMLFVVPSFAVAVFFPSSTFAGNILRYVLLLVVAILLRNTNPRVRIDQAIKFFWFYTGPVSLLAVGLALAGK